MIVVFIAIAGLFVDSGYSSALIQRKEVTEEDKTSVFLFNISAGLAMAAVMCGAAPAIARFYKQPILTGLTRLMALNLLIQACGSVQFALLSRQLDFKTQWKVGMAATAVSGAVAVVLAWRGYGVWSLAIQANISALIIDAAGLVAGTVAAQRQGEHRITAVDVRIRIARPRCGIDEHGV